MYTASAEASTSLLHRNKIIELNAWALIIINRSNIKEKKKLKFLGTGHNNQYRSTKCHE